MTISKTTAPEDGNRFTANGLAGKTLGVAAAFAALVALSACTGNDQQAATQSAATGAAATQAQIEGTVHVCSSCHGLEGRSISSTFPRLAGQDADYIESQLKSFRDHTRADPHAHTYMWGMAAHLTDPLIEGLATYYAAQTPAPGTPGDPAEMAAGKKIFQTGIPATSVPPCQTCHGDNGQGMADFPRLAGQHQEYLIEQLQNFTSNARDNAIMHANAEHLTAEEIRQITAYLSSL